MHSHRPQRLKQIQMQKSTPEKPKISSNWRLCSANLTSILKNIITETLKDKNSRTPKGGGDIPVQSMSTSLHSVLPGTKVHVLPAFGTIHNDAVNEKVQL